jgi:hypothetical protein
MGAQPRPRRAGSSSVPCPRFPASVPRLGSLGSRLCRGSRPGSSDSGRTSRECTGSRRAVRVLPRHAEQLPDLGERHPFGPEGGYLKAALSSGGLPDGKGTLLRVSHGALARMKPSGRPRRLASDTAKRLRGQ